MHFSKNICSKNLNLEIEILPAMYSCQTSEEIARVIYRNISILVLYYDAVLISILSESAKGEFNSLSTNKTLLTSLDSFILKWTCHI